MKNKLSGIYPALRTPFKANGEVKLGGIRKLSTKGAAVTLSLPPMRAEIIYTFCMKTFSEQRVTSQYLTVSG